MKGRQRVHKTERRRIIWQAPRLEGKVKNVGIKPVRKKRAARAEASTPKKPQGVVPRQRKDYQLKSKRRK